MNSVTEIRLDSGEMGRIWQDGNRFGWAHPNGSEGNAETFAAAEADLAEADRAAITEGEQ